MPYEWPCQIETAPNIHHEVFITKLNENEYTGCNPTMHKIYTNIDCPSEFCCASNSCLTLSLTPANYFYGIIVLRQCILNQVIMNGNN